MNKEIKRTCMRFFFGTEVILMLGIYIFGQHSLSEISHLHHDVLLLKTNIGDLQQDIALLAQRIEDWTTYPYYKEKMAREQLHMACQDDQIFYL